MTYKSQDLQKICGQFVGKNKLPNSLIRAAKKYNPRLGSLLIGTNKKVFESDLKKLAQFLQDSQEGEKFSPNRYLKSSNTKAKFHKQAHKLKNGREEEKYAPDKWKQNQIKNRLKKIQNLQSKKRTDLLIKKIAMRKTEKPEDKKIKAEEYLKNIVQLKSKTENKTGNSKPFSAGSSVPKINLVV